MRLLLLLLSCLPLPLHAQGGVRLYVKADAAGAGSGLSWADAYPDLQSALAVAQAGDTVWVAAGVYYPTSGADRQASFAPPGGVGLYGGFAGHETALEQRDWTVHLTVLSGDIGTPGDSTDNSYNVVYLHEPDSLTVLDGLVIRHGAATHPQNTPAYDRRRCGGGLYIMAADADAYPTIRHCRFERNSCRFSGAGVMINAAGDGSAAPRFVDCVFAYNHALRSGGGMAKIGGSWVERGVDIDGCLFEHNRADARGGGFYYLDSERTDTLELRRSRFVHNEAEDGGGAYVVGERDNGAVFVMDSCVFRENRAPRISAFALTSQGFSFAYAKSVQVTNCEFSENRVADGMQQLLPKTIAIEPITEPVSELRFNNNKILRNTGSENTLYIIVDEITKAAIFNCNITGNKSSTTFSISADTVLFYHNIVEGNITELGSICRLSARYKASFSNSVFFNNISLTALTSLIKKKNVFFDLRFISIYNCRGYNNLSSANAAGRVSMHNSWVVGYSNLADLFWADTLTEVSHCYFDTLDYGALPSYIYDNVVLGPGIIVGVDPLLRDTAAGDFRLSPCSPLLDAGDDAYVAGWPPFDLSGAPRVQGVAVDIGPYESAPPRLDDPPQVLPSCPGGASGSVAFAAVDGCPPYGFAWNGPAGTAGQDTSGLSPGLYYFTLTDSRGTALTDTVQVPDSGAGPTLTPWAQAVVCGDTLGGSAGAAVSGARPPLLFAWAGGSTDSLRAGLPAGLYHLTVTDAAGCTAQASVQVGKTGGLDVDIQVESIICPDGADGSLGVLPLDGKAPYRWRWESGDTTAVRTALTAGIYRGTLTDALGCTMAWVLPLDDPGAIGLSAQITAASGSSAADGRIELTALQGGTPPYTILWADGPAGPLRDSLPPGDYTVTVTDSQGCSQAETFTVSFDSAVQGPAAPAAPGGLRVAPNPSDGRFTLQFDAPFSGRVRILDLHGRVVWERVVEHATALMPDIPLPAGVYEVSAEQAHIRLRKKLAIVR